MSFDFDELIDDDELETDKHPPATPVESTDSAASSVHSVPEYPSIRIFNSASGEAHTAFTGRALPSFSVPDPGSIVTGREVVSNISAKDDLNTVSSYPELEYDPDIQPVYASASPSVLPPELVEEGPAQEEPQTHTDAAKSRRKWPVIAVAGMALIAAGGGIILVGSLLFGRDDSDNSAVQEPSAVEDVMKSSDKPKPKSPVDILREHMNSSCQEGQEGSTITTRRDGNAETPEGAIKGFEYAYYVKRDAKLASQFLSPSAYSSVENLQKGIDALPEASDYCLSITPGEQKDVFDVDLSVYSVSGAGAAKPEETTYAQRFTMKEEPSGYVLSAIQSRK